MFDWRVGGLETCGPGSGGALNWPVPPNGNFGGRHTECACYTGEVGRPAPNWSALAELWIVPSWSDGRDSRAAPQGAPTALAMTNAAVAARPPTTTVCQALRKGLGVVKRPLI